MSVILILYLCADPSNLYTELLPGWASYGTSARISAGRGSATRTECIWVNPHCHSQLNRLSLFGEIR